MRERKSYEDNQNSYLSENKLFIIFAGVTFLLFIALALFSYNSFIKGQESSEVVLIKADEQPYKVTPEDPGGMKVNYQDKEVFNTLVGKEGAAPGQPETAQVDEQQQPLSPEEVMRKAEGATAQQLASAEAENKAATPAEASNISPESAATAGNDNESMPAVSEAPEATPAKEEQPEIPANVDVNKGVIKISEPEKEEAQEKPAEKAKPQSIAKKEAGAKNTLESSSTTKAKATTAASQKGGKYYVQLGAFSSMHSLDKSWKEISTKNKSAITGGKLVKKIERGGKTLYSLGFGPYKQKIAATEACNKLKAKSQDCIVKDQ